MMSQHSDAGGAADDSEAAARWRRLRWRSRRGLLENDLLISRHLDAHAASMSETQVAALDELLDMSDRDLLDLLLDRTIPDDRMPSAAAIELVHAIRRG